MEFEKFVLTKAGGYVFLFLYWVYLAVRWLLSRPLGWLVLSIGLYWWMSKFSIVKPMGFSNLAIWIGEQSSDVKIALATALITVFGFLIAFSSANASWRMQRRTEIRLAAADEIYKFFDEAMALILKIEIFSEHVSKVFLATNGADRTEEDDFIDGAIILRDLPGIVKARERLSETLCPRSVLVSGASFQ